MAGPATLTLSAPIIPDAVEGITRTRVSRDEYDRQGQEKNTLKGECYGFINLFPACGGHTFVKHRSSLVFANGDRPGSRDTLQASRET